jgi:hypothetical protein
MSTVNNTNNPENQSKIYTTVVCISCLSFFPLMYLIGSTIVAYLH